MLCFGWMLFDLMWENFQNAIFLPLQLVTQIQKLSHLSLCFLKVLASLPLPTVASSLIY